MPRPLVGVSATVTTTPVFTGTASLRVSADIANGGHLVVRVVGEDNQLLAESEPLTESATDEEIKWLEAVALDALNMRPARLQFEFKQATVYSFSLFSDP